MTLGLLIQQERKLRGLSQVELCKSVSISQAKLSKFESGVHDIDASTLIKLLTVLRIKLKWRST